MALTVEKRRKVSAPVGEFGLELFNRSQYQLFLFLNSIAIFLCFYYHILYILYNCRIYSWKAIVVSLVPPFSPPAEPTRRQLKNLFSSTLQPPSNPPTMSDSSQVAGKRKRAREYPYCFPCIVPLTLVSRLSWFSSINAFLIGFKIKKNLQRDSAWPTMSQRFGEILAPNILYFVLTSSLLLFSSAS